ncbi:hypothetical protein DPMN_183263 [Dreissena polymorpha]|uniref:Uncharacterized protein n=1 Tax=Dreissena polymorpha TaxID=45954 RepID=A0A9D4I676_DREPO|nr:hypothetical protein DPMN_183263 [Dreissena polymorpha]
MATPIRLPKSGMPTPSNCPQGPSNADIVTYFKRIDDRISLKYTKFEVIDKLEKKVEGINGHLKEILAFLHTINKKTSAK